jgi:hypothetical protein
MTSATWLSWQTDLHFPYKSKERDPKSSRGPLYKSVVFTSAWLWSSEYRRKTYGCVCENSGNWPLGCLHIIPRAVPSGKPSSVTLLLTSVCKASAQCVGDGWLPYYDFSKKLESSSKLCSSSFYNCGSQWLHGLKRRPWSLGPWDRWFVSRLRHGCLSSSFCGVLSCVGRGFCDGLITRPEEPYRVSKQINETSRVWFVQGPIEDRKAAERWWLFKKIAKLRQMWCV